jgi:hypothetical protein
MAQLQFAFWDGVGGYGGQKRQRAKQEHQRAESLAARLRALGIEPEEALEHWPIAYRTVTIGP